MSIELLINVTPSESRVALIENGVLQEIQLERIGNLGIVGNIYLGMFTCFRPAFEKYLIALWQKNFLLFQNTAADMIHLLGRPLSMHM